MSDKNDVLITGATGGIGRALSMVFAEHGYNLLLCGRNLPALLYLKDEIELKTGVKVRCFSADLSRPGDALSLAEAVHQAGYQVDILINNAGLGFVGGADMISESQDHEQNEVNIQALTTLTKYFLREMYKRGKGKILNVASTGAFQPGPYTASYFASKAYVLSYTKAVREEAKAHGVSVCCLCPGTTRTDFFEKAGQTMPFFSMNPEKVAKIAYQGLMKDQAVIIPGTVNRIICAFPQGLKTRVIANIKRQS